MLSLREFFKKCEQVSWPAVAVGGLAGAVMATGMATGVASAFAVRPSSLAMQDYRDSVDGATAAIVERQIEDLNSAYKKGGRSAFYEAAFNLLPSQIHQTYTAALIADCHSVVSRTPDEQLLACTAEMMRREAAQKLNHPAIAAASDVALPAGGVGGLVGVLLTATLTSALRKKEMQKLPGPTQG